MNSSVSQARPAPCVPKSAAASPRAISLRHRSQPVAHNDFQHARFRPMCGSRFRRLSRRRRIDLGAPEHGTVRTGRYDVGVACRVFALTWQMSAELADRGWKGWGMRVTAGIFGLLIAVAGAVMMCLGYIAQHDLRDDSARSTPGLGMTCQANRDNPRLQDCSWGWWDGHNSTRGEDIMPVRERTGELISDVVLIGAALFVGGLVLTGGALAGGGRTRHISSAMPPQQWQQPAAQWSGAPSTGHPGGV